MDKPLLTVKQAHWLGLFTRTKWFLDDKSKIPTMEEASPILDSCFQWNTALWKSPQLSEQLYGIALDKVKKWHPEVVELFKLPPPPRKPDGRKGGRRGGKRVKQDGPDIFTNPEPPKPEPKPEPKVEPKVEVVVEKVVDVKPVEKIEGLDPVIASTLERIKAGIANFFWCGPAGTGKSTMAKMVADHLKLDFWLESCSEGTPPSAFLGRETGHVGFTEAYGKPGVICVDEIPMLDPSVAAGLNAALANGFIFTRHGVKVERHPNCIIIATANTFGHGGSRQYVGNNQLDAATLDRFVGGKIEVDYSPVYESQYDSEVVRYVRGLRETVKVNGFRRVVSTRSVIAGHKLKAAGLEWKQAIVADWTPEEREAIHA